MEERNVNEMPTFKSLKTDSLTTAHESQMLTQELSPAESTFKSRCAALRSSWKGLQSARTVPLVVLEGVLNKFG